MTETEARVSQRDVRLRDLLREAIEELHQVGLVSDHADPTDRTGWNVHGIETCGYPLCRDALAALAAADSIDDAWIEAESELPKGWWLHLRRYRLLTIDAHIYEAEAANSEHRIEEIGPTPAAALRVLAEKLRALGGAG